MKKQEEEKDGETEEISFLFLPAQLAPYKSKPKKKKNMFRSSRPDASTLRCLFIFI